MVAASGFPVLECWSFPLDWLWACRSVKELPCHWLLLLILLCFSVKQAQVIVFCIILIKHSLYLNPGLSVLFSLLIVGERRGVHL